MPTKELPQSLFPVGLVGDPSSMVEVPVLAASCTTIPGALVVGVCVHHNVMDGLGLGNMIRTWAINCRQGGNGTQIPASDHLAERWNRCYCGFLKPWGGMKRGGGRWRDGGIHAWMASIIPVTQVGSLDTRCIADVVAAR